MESQPYLHWDAGQDRRSPPLLVFFNEVAVKNEKLSEDGGSPVYDRVVQARIIAPGQKNSFPIYELMRTDPNGVEKVAKREMERFRETFNQWRTKQDPVQGGTPLEQWPLMDVAMVAAFKDANIFTVQQLGAVSDAVLDTLRMRDGRQWRAKAAAWLEDGKAAAGDAQARASIAKLEAQNAELRQMIEKMQQKNNGVGFDKPKRGKKDDISVSIDADEDEVRV